MKKKLVFILMGLSLPTLSFANCGYVPAGPGLLEQSQLSTAQVESLEAQMEVYFQSVESYKTCIDGEVGNLAPADAPEEFYESISYQTSFEDLMSYSDLAQQGMNSAIERYNYLLETATSQ